MPRALVLNVSYEPLSVVSIRRALVLVLGERAEVVESNGHVWHSEHIEIAAPSVIRLRRYVRVHHDRRVPVNRRSVFLRDGGDFAAMNAVYAEFFGNDKPARTTVETKFADTRMIVEIDCVAYQER